MIEPRHKAQDRIILTICDLMEETDMRFGQIVENARLHTGVDLFYIRDETMANLLVKFVNKQARYQRWYYRLGRRLRMWFNRAY